MNHDYSQNDKRLDVVHIISGLGHGGAETVLHRLLTAASQSDRHCVISMGDLGVFGPKLQAAGIRVYPLEMRGVRGMASGFWQLYRLLRELRPDVVQTWMYHADLVGGIVARLAGIKAVAWGIRNSGADLQKSSRTARALAWVCARLSAIVPGVIVACADNAAQRHVSWGYRGDRTLVIANGYDLSLWQPDNQARVALRQELGLAGDTPLIGSVARWNPLKDHDNLLEALALSARAYPDVRCVLIGEGLDSHNVELTAMLQRHGLEDRVILLGRRTDVPQWMNALDIHVLSSRAEGFPNVVAEAMASGTLCVVTDVGDAARIVDDTGWVAPPRNALALSQALNTALGTLGSPEATDRQQRGRQRVASLFSLDTMVHAYHVVWARLAADYPSPRRAIDPAQGDSPYRDATGWTVVADDSTEATVARRPRLLFVVNNPAFFLSHRLPLALKARDDGFEVHIATMDGPSVPVIVGHGLTHHVINMSRSGKNPVMEIQSIYSLWRLFRQLRPDLIHAVTIKPVLYGGIAARLAGVPAYIAAVSGLGFIFTRPAQKMDFMRWAATLLYRLALGHKNSRVIFQNQNDRDVLQQAGVLRSGQAVLIRGSGVALDEFHYVPEPDGVPVAIMVSRLLVDKGVMEFVEAARLSHDHPSGLRWLLVGSPDRGNPASVTDGELLNWQREGVVEYLGERTDIAALYQQSNIAVLPSYREGLPKSLVEAAACGRAVVTTDVPGCRDAIQPVVTGVLVPPRNARALATAVIALAEDTQLRQQMGAAGRELAEAEFDVQKIADRHVELYWSLCGGRPGAD
ncbi:MAG: glycosyltransferase [Burkholderiaceae bacterium]|nr:glycosyltransferase [Burkholderiaceae bacterium]